MDDSDGSTGWSRDELVELHHDACLQGNPDPVAIAERLFHSELYSKWETFYEAAERYQDVLGSEGLATYRAMAEEMWARVPDRGRDADDDFSTFRFHITRIMEALARTFGRRRCPRSHQGPKSLLRVPLRGNLRGSPRRRPTRRGPRMGRTWPRRVPGEHRHTPTRAHRRRIPPPRSPRRRHDPGLGHALRTPRPAATSASTTTPQSRARGTSGARRPSISCGRRPKQRRPTRPLGPGGRSQPTTPAWSRCSSGETTSARRGRRLRRADAPHGLWKRLASTREGDHPADAIPIYQDHVEHTIQLKKNEAYAEAVEWIHKIRHLLDRLDRSNEFSSYAAEVRARHKPKRNLMKLFDSAGW